MRQVDCPWGGWIGLPDEWLGEHARRRDEARERLNEQAELTKKKLPATWQNFIVAMAVLEDWDIPGLTGNPEKWDLAAMPWAVLDWLPMVVFASIASAQQVPKNSSAPLPDGSMAAAEKGQPGTSESPA